jgi:hypothetical protein
MNGASAPPTAICAVPLPVPYHFAGEESPYCHASEEIVALTVPLASVTMRKVVSS